MWYAISASWTTLESNWLSVAVVLVKLVLLVCSGNGWHEYRTTVFVQILHQSWTQYNGNICKTLVGLRRQYLSKGQKFRWFKAFAEWRESSEDEPHSRRLSVSRTDAKVDKSPGSCACRSLVDSQIDWDIAEFESHHHSCYWAINWGWEKSAKNWFWEISCRTKRT